MALATRGGSRLADAATAPTEYERIADAIRAGDKAAMAELYDLLSPRAFGLALRILGERGAAEDAIQEAFLTVWRQSAQVDRARGKLVSYVLTIVHHKAVDIARRRQGIDARLRSVDPANLHLIPDDVSVAAISDYDAATVHTCLGQLPDDQRAVIDLAYFGGLSASEIARQLAIPAGTVKSRMRLGLVRLRHSLTEAGFP